MTVPGAPRNVRYDYEFGGNRLTVSWDASESGGVPNDSYQWTLSRAGRVVSAGGDQLSTTFTFLEPGSDYLFTVSAVNSVGRSVSTSVPVTVAYAPGAPANVQAGRGDGAAQVSWTAPDSRGAPISSYQITAQPGGRVVTVPGTATSVTVGNLTNGIRYQFTVLANNLVGSGPNSALSSTVTPAGLPKQPGIVRNRTARHRALTVTWTRAAGNGVPITSYQTTCGTRTVTVSSGARIATVSRVTSGRRYRCKVRATSAVGAGAYRSATTTVRTH